MAFREARLGRFGALVNGLDVRGVGADELYCGQKKVVDLRKSWVDWAPACAGATGSWGDGDFWG